MQWVILFMLGTSDSQKTFSQLQLQLLQIQFDVLRYPANENTNKKDSEKQHLLK